MFHQMSQKPNLFKGKNRRKRGTDRGETTVENCFSLNYEE